MDIPVLDVAKRTYFNNERGLRYTEEQIENLKAMYELSRKFRFTTSLLISTDEAISNSKLDRNQIERARVLVGKIRDIGIPVSYDPYGQTALSKFQQQVFPIKEPQANTILAICCLDQYPLYKQEQVEVALELAERVKKDGSLYGSGSRDVPVELGVHKISSYMRIIHELAQLLSTDHPKQFRVFDKPDSANPSAPYNVLGEFTPGFYFFNPIHPAYPRLAREIHERPDLIHQTGFSLEYLAAGTAGNIEGGVTTGYVHAVRNLFYSEVTEADEIERASKFITAQTSQVASTSFGPHLRRFLREPERQKPLVELFDEETLQETLGIMKKAAA